MDVTRDVEKKTLSVEKTKKYIVMNHSNKIRSAIRMSARALRDFLSQDRRGIYAACFSIPSHCSYKLFPFS